MPADYVRDADIRPLSPHFVDGSTLPLLLLAVEDMANDEAADLYDPFLRAREAAMIEEIRRACGITQVSDAAAAARSTPG